MANYVGSVQRQHGLSTSRSNGFDRSYGSSAYFVAGSINRGPRAYNVCLSSNGEPSAHRPVSLDVWGKWTAVVVMSWFLIAWSLFILLLRPYQPLDIEFSQAYAQYSSQWHESGEHGPVLVLNLSSGSRGQAAVIHLLFLILCRSPVLLARRCQP